MVRMADNTGCVNQLFNIEGIFAFGDIIVCVGAPHMLKYPYLFILQCFSPSHFAMGSSKVPLAVSCNGGFYISVAQTFFTFDPPFRLLNLDPILVSISGGTQLTIVGENFVSTSDAICRFGVPFGFAITNPQLPFVYTAASVVANQSIATCLTPAHPISSLQMVELSLNGLDFSIDALQLLYYNMSISSVWPAIGPAAGGQLLTVVGDGFINTTQLVFSVGGATVIPKFITPTMVLLNMPPLSQTNGWPSTTLLTNIGSVSATGAIFTTQVNATLNQRDFTSLLVYYQYYVGNISVALFSPSTDWRGGGVVVTVMGNNFFNTSLLVCRFGFQRVPAIFISSESLTCQSPAPYNMSTNGYLEVSNNDQDFSMNQISFSYQLLPIGFYLVGNLPVACPIGMLVISLIKQPAIHDFVVLLLQIPLFQVRFAMEYIHQIGPPVIRVSISLTHNNMIVCCALAGFTVHQVGCLCL